MNQGRSVGDGFQSTHDEFKHVCPKLLDLHAQFCHDPPPGFETEAKPLLRPVPFSVRTYRLPDLFAGKMHALLCRRWRNRVKGRDWYDFVWYVANHPQLHLSHLEQRMRQSGDYTSDRPLTLPELRERLRRAIEGLDIVKARDEVSPFVSDWSSLQVWSPEFFASLVDQIEMV